MEPKFTVIIPTRERADTLYHALRSVVAQDYSNLDIIVSDNHSQDDTRKVVDSFPDPRIRYINTGKRVSMSHNWEFALSHVKEGWVTFLGDDDGLLPGALERVAEVIQKTKCKAVTSSWCIYSWPNVENKLTVSLTDGIEIRSCRKWLRKLLNGSALYSELPFIYTGGFVDIDVINQAKLQSKFFHSMAPDVYSAVALASTIGSYVFLRKPVVCLGVSHHSTGASGIGHLKNDNAVKKFFSEDNIPFHPIVAKADQLSSLPMIIFESYLQCSHVHKKALSEDMLADQLGLAIAESTRKNAVALKEYCMKIAEGNNLDLDFAIFKHRIRKFIRDKYVYSKNVIMNLIGNPPHIEFSGEELYIKNVYDAALAARAMLSLYHKKPLREMLSRFLKRRGFK